LRFQRQSVQTQFVYHAFSEFEIPMQHEPSKFCSSPKSCLQERNDNVGVKVKRDSGTNCHGQRLRDLNNRGAGFSRRWKFFERSIFLREDRKSRKKTWKRATNQLVYFS
jgi:hypothetical protein